jgi:hypothetical protein
MARAGPVPAPATSYVATSRPDRASILLLDSALVAGATAAITAVAMRLWDVSLRIPLDYDGDGLISLEWVKTLVQTGWVNSTSRLGAPFGQVYYDFPLGGDNLNFLFLRALAAVSKDWALTTNVFFLLGFPIAAVAAYHCLRWLQVRRALAGAAAILYAFVPYHFYRGTEHLLLASYAVIPVAVLLAARAASGTFPWQPTRQGGSWPSSLGRALPWLALALVAGSCGAYYMVFALVLIGAAGVLGAVAAKSWRPVTAGAATAGVVGAMFVVNISGSLLYWHRHGPDRLVGQRSIGELDAYSLRVTELLTPVPSHWFPPFRWAAERLLTPNPTAETAQFLGTIGALAFLAMIVVLVLACIGRRPPGGPTARLVLALTAVVVLIGSAGGLAWFGNVVGFTEVRAWSRASIVVAFLVLAWLTLVAGDLAHRIVLSSRRARLLAAIGLAAVVVVGVLDQVPDPTLPRAGAESALDFESDRAYFAAVEAAVPEDAMIYQFPYRPFPEQGPTYLSTDYDLSRPFLNTERVRWSYGGMKGREAEWQRQLVDRPVPEVLDDLVAVGYAGLLVDRLGYADHGAAFEHDIQAVLGSPPMVDRSGRWAFYDLAPYVAAATARLGRSALDARRQQLLAAPWLDRTGCSVQEGTGEAAFTWCGRDGSLLVTSESFPRRVRLTGSARAPVGPATLDLRTPDGPLHLRIGPDPTPIDVTVDLDRRVTSLPFRSDARKVVSADARDLYIQLIDMQVAAA